MRTKDSKRWKLHSKLSIDWSDKKQVNEYNRNYHKNRTHEQILNDKKRWKTQYKKQKPAMIARYNENKKDINARISERNSKLRLQIIKYYSNGVMVCGCCGESIVEFLTIEHTFGKKTNNKNYNSDGYHLYSWIVKKDYPNGFEILCYNCNCAKGKYGICPHKT